MDTWALIGEISYQTNGQTHHLAVAGGFAEILPHRVTILADTAERPAEIDIKRADQAKSRAENRLKGADANLDFARAQASTRTRPDEATGCANTRLASKALISAYPRLSLQDPIVEA
jgi:F0F1-type ATP synthase epsilon subunit